MTEFARLLDKARKSPSNANIKKLADHVIEHRVNEDKLSKTTTDKYTKVKKDLPKIQSDYNKSVKGFKPAKEIYNTEIKLMDRIFKQMKDSLVEKIATATVIERMNAENEDIETEIMPHTLSPNIQ